MNHLGVATRAKECHKVKLLRDRKIVTYHEELPEDGADAVAERRHEHDRERPRVLPKRGRRQWLRSENARGGAHEERGEEVREASPPALATALPRVPLHHPAVVGRSLVRAAL